uniref:Adhesion G protein-coupled receptor F5-like n=1 Tax=Gadus morhua TaxID=8049 RepID=A0A8C5D0V4_GADMO
MYLKWILLHDASVLTAGPPVNYEYLITIELQTTNVTVIEDLRSILDKIIYPFPIDSNILISEVNITTVCSPFGAGFQFKCEDPYRWPCDKCLLHGSCDNITDETCGCINALPPDEEYCQLSQLMVYEYLTTIELQTTNVTVIEELRSILDNISYPFPIDNNILISEVNITTVCSPFGAGFQCTCEDPYRWPCDKCLLHGSCDNITDETCGCINALPPDEEYCPPVVYEYLTTIELQTTNVTVIEELRSILDNISYPFPIDSNILISEVNITAVCSPFGAGFQCTCEDPYRWPCDKCLLHGSCDNITDETCGCINALPPDEEYCQLSQLSPPLVYVYLTTIELQTTNVTVIEELRSILDNISYPFPIDSNILISEVNITTVCSPFGAGFQCTCEDPYRWPCDKCLLHGSCDNITDETCGCINALPPDEEYSTSTPSPPPTSTPSPPTTSTTSPPPTSTPSPPPTSTPSPPPTSTPSPPTTSTPSPPPTTTISPPTTSTTSPPPTSSTAPPASTTPSPPPTSPPPTSSTAPPASTTPSPPPTSTPSPPPTSTPSPPPTSTPSPPPTSTPNTSTTSPPPTSTPSPPTTSTTSPPPTSTTSPPPTSTPSPPTTSTTSPPPTSTTSPPPTSTPSPPPTSTPSPQTTSTTSPPPTSTPSPPPTTTISPPTTSTTSPPPTSTTSPPPTSTPSPPPTSTTSPPTTSTTSPPPTSSTAPPASTTSPPPTSTPSPPPTSTTSPPTTSTPSPPPTSTLSPPTTSTTSPPPTSPPPTSTTSPPTTSTTSPPPTSTPSPPPTSTPSPPPTSTTSPPPTSTTSPPPSSIPSPPPTSISSPPPTSTPSPPPTSTTSPPPTTTTSPPPGKTEKNRGRFQIISNATGSRLTISNLIPSDRGESPALRFIQRGRFTTTTLLAAPVLLVNRESNAVCRGGGNTDTPRRCCVQPPYRPQWVGVTPGKHHPTVTGNNCVQYDYRFDCTPTTVTNICRVIGIPGFQASIICNNTRYGEGGVGDESRPGCGPGLEGERLAVCQASGVWLTQTNTCINTYIFTNINDFLTKSEGDVPTFVANLSGLVSDNQTQITDSPVTISAIVDILTNVGNVSTIIKEDTIILNTVDVIVGDVTVESWADLNANRSLNTSSLLLSSMETITQFLSGDDFSVNTSSILLNRTRLSDPFMANINSSLVINLQNTNLTDTFITTITFSTLSNVLPPRTNASFNASQDANATGPEILINAAVVLIQLNGSRALRPNLTLSYRKRNTSLTEDPQCVFWNFQLLDFQGGWDDEGCTFVSDVDDVVECNCDHLTSFSILMSTGLPPGAAEALDIITYIGVAISIVSLVICLIIEALTWKAMTGNTTSYLRHVSLVNIAVSLLIADIWFIIGAAITSETDPTEMVPLAACSAATFFIHLFYLALFFWMLVSALLLFYRMVMVFSHMSKATMLAIGFSLGYGAPLVIAVVTEAATAPQVPQGYIRDNNGCWLRWEDTFALLAFIIPAGVIVFINFVILIVVLTKMLRRGVESSHSEEKNTLLVILRSVAILFPTFGLTWALGVGVMVAPRNLGLHVTFALFNSLQVCGRHIVHLHSGQTLLSKVSNKSLSNQYFIHCLFRGHYNIMNRRRRVPEVSPSSTTGKDMQ